MTDSQIKRAFLERWIVPNFYSSSHFEEMNRWTDEKVEIFKRWLADKVCNDDPFREIMLDYIQDFEEQRVDECKLCHTNCDVDDLCPHGVAHEQGFCACVCQECYDEMEEEEAEEEDTEKMSSNSYVNGEYCGEPGSLNFLLGIPLSKALVTDEIPEWYFIKQMYSSPKGNAGDCEKLCRIDGLERATKIWKSYCEANSTKEFFNETGFN
jgi:hypothetical protein